MRILKLYIENFKGVRNGKLIDFSQSLVILRGPNGFGKTTIFDAIELCLTGSIKRVVDKARVTNDSKDYSDAFYRNTSKKDVKLKLLIENESKERIVIVKYLPFDHDGNFGEVDSRAKKYKVVDSLEKLPTYILSEEEFGNDEFHTIHSPENNYGEKIQQFIFGESSTLEVKDIYKLFGYIQQEQNTFYLDLSETKRRDELDFLYNSQDQSREVDDLARSLDQLKKAEAALEIELQNLNTEQKTSIKKDSSYERVFQFIELEFDSKNPFAQESPRTLDVSYRSAIDYVRRIKHFTETFDHKVYQNNLKKKTLNSLARNENFQYFFILKEFLKDEVYKNIAEEYEFSSWVNETSVVQYYILQKFLNDTNFNKIHRIAKSHSTAQEYLKLRDAAVSEKLKALLRIKDENLVSEEKRQQGAKLLDRLQQGAKILTDSSAILVSMDELRGKLSELLERSGKHTHLQDSECPFCGYDWRQREELKKSILEKDTSLKRLSEDQTGIMTKLMKEIDEDFVSVLEKHFAEYITKSEGGYKFYKKLESLKGSVNETDFNAFSKRLELTIPNAKDYIWKEFKTQDELNTHVESIKLAVNTAISYDSKVFERLQGLKGYNFDNAVSLLGTELSKEFSWQKMHTHEKLINDQEKLAGVLSGLATDIEIDEEKLGGQDADFFKDVFLEKVSNVDQVSPKLDSKIEYITFKYNQKQNALHELLEGRRKKIKAVRIRVNTLRASYKTAINDYKNTMTDAVKIPFHIYSARILQNYSQGYGAFIDTPSQSTSSIRFSAGSGSDHDLVHQLSSGQLAVVSMAFSLAINKVYGSASLRFLAIDDPVQELDALNVYSLIELLRSDFGVYYQLLLSTHDDLHADYMAYKFALDDRDVKSIKVQELFFPTTKNSPSK